MTRWRIVRAEPPVDLRTHRYGFWHNVIAHALMFAAPRIGLWLHDITPTVVRRRRPRR